LGFRRRLAVGPPSHVFQPPGLALFVCRQEAKEDGHSESESDDDYWTDDDDVSTPIDDVNPYTLFADALSHLQAHHPARFQVGRLSEAGGTRPSLTRPPVLDNITGVRIPCNSAKEGPLSCSTCKKGGTVSYCFCNLSNMRDGFSFPRARRRESR
jgi:hypothetical protein